MSVRTELSRTMPILGPSALEAMLAILGALSRHEAPYDHAALSMGLDRIRLTAGDVSVPVSVEVGSQPQRYECELTMRATSAPHLFPTFTGSLSISPLRESGSELWLQGTYTVPLGAAGEFVDATLLRGAADASLERFVSWLSEEIVERVDRGRRADPTDR